MTGTARAAKRPHSTSARGQATPRRHPGPPTAWFAENSLYNTPLGQQAGLQPTRGRDRRRRAIPAKIFVGNLSFRTTKEELGALLAAAGAVVDLYMPADRATGKPRGFAFVEFATQAEAEEAIRQLNGRDVGGRSLKVNLTEERPARRPAGPRSFGGPPEPLAGPSFFPVEGRFSKPKGSRRGTRGRKRSL